MNINDGILDRSEVFPQLILILATENHLLFSSTIKEINRHLLSVG